MRKRATKLTSTELRLPGPLWLGELDTAGPIRVGPVSVTFADRTPPIGPAATAVVAAATLGCSAMATGWPASELSGAAGGGQAAIGPVPIERVVATPTPARALSAPVRRAASTLRTNARVGTDAFVIPPRATVNPRSTVAVKRALTVPQKAVATHQTAPANAATAVAPISTVDAPALATPPTRSQLRATGTNMGAGAKQLTTSHRKSDPAERLSGTPAQPVLPKPVVEHADVAGLAGVELARSSSRTRWHSWWGHSSAPSTPDPSAGTSDPAAPADTPPTDTTPVDTTPADTTPVDTTPVDTTPADTTPAASSDPASTGTTPGDSTSVADAGGPAQSAPALPAAAESAPADASPVGEVAASPAPAAAFWSATSFLNTLLSSFSVNPSSSSWLGELEASEPQGLWVDDTQWTPPIYHASSSTPTATVSIENTGERITVPYDPSFTPDPSGDSQLAVIDDATGCEYEFQAFDPSSLTAHAEATFSLRNDTGALGAGHGGGVTGASISELGGLITPQDIASGSINHALRVGTPINSSSFVAPATSSDGGTPGGIPEGQLVRLDPSLDLSQFNLDPFQLMVATALQRYGGYVADNSGSFKVYAESTVDGSVYSATPNGLPWSVASRLQFGSTNLGSSQITATETAPGCNQEH